MGDCWIDDGAVYGNGFIAGAGNIDDEGYGAGSADGLGYGYYSSGYGDGDSNGGGYQNCSGLG